MQFSGAWSSIMRQPNSTLTIIRGTNTGSIPEKSSNMLQRAKNAAQQMRYFGLVVRKCSFSEVVPSAQRAGFALLGERPTEKEMFFKWNLDEPDFVFSLSYQESGKVWIIAESRADIMGLTLVSHSLSSDISVDTKPWLGFDELGSNALQFQELLLTLPGFVETPAWVTMGE
jgi:hypothetical protein